MKVKLKLDSQKLKQLALEHAEKVVFGIIAIVTLLLVFKSFGLPKFEKTPSDLQSATQAAQNALQTSEGEATQFVHNELKPKDFLPIANKNAEKFKPKGFAWNIVKPPIYPTGGPRQEPEYLLVEDLHAHSGRGVFVSPGAPQAIVANNDTEMAPDDDGKVDAAADSALAKPGRQLGGSKVGRTLSGPSRGPSIARNNGESLSYVVVLGKVPYAKQRQAYDDAVGMPNIAFLRIVIRSI